MALYESIETDRMPALKDMELASFSRRAISFLVDLAIASFLFFVVFSVIEPFLIKMGWIKSDQEIIFALNLNWYSIAWVVMYFGLAVYFGNGKTPGKCMIGIRIVSTAHERISLWHSIERALGYGYSTLEFFFGFIQFFLYPNRRTLHDRIAETIVIREKKKKTN
ncbi:MAG: RDD family protein [Bacteroidetes bacterium]|nr:RDD family protein [Bacteroidota bacterium]